MNIRTALAPAGRSARELSDAELEQQGRNAHDTRNWVFLNGTAEQFATHTARMLELEQEYLRRYPQRTWQGTGGGPTEQSEVDVLKQALRGVIAQLVGLMDFEAPTVHAHLDVSTDPAAVLLARIAKHPGGRMHKLEVHQLAREVGLERAALARMYTGDPALLTIDHHDRAITEAGRAIAEGAR